MNPLIKKIRWWPREKTAVAVMGFLLILGHFLIFSRLFSISEGMGHDFAMGLPLLLDGYFWFRNNGFFPVFWFSPFLCGGVPAFAHPIHFFYSAPQFLTFLLDPFCAVLLNFFIFAAIGFWGHYLLTRRALGAGVWTSLLCATIFLFNGFYTYHYIIGHFIYHSFMLVPWCVLLLVNASRISRRGNQGGNLAACAGVALMLSYMVYSAMQTLMPPVLLSIAVTSLICGLALGRDFSVWAWMSRFAAAGLMALGISAAKLSALFHLLDNVPRNNYALPQFTDWWDLLRVLMQSLFFTPAWETARQTMINMQFKLQRHEFEFGMTFIPLIILGTALVALGRYLPKVSQVRSPYAQRPLPAIASLGIISLLLLLPVALNYYTPAWNRFLKSVPVVGSSSQCTRWFCMYIPVITLLTAMAVEKTPVLTKKTKIIAVIGMLGVLWLNLTADKSYYRQATYSPLPVMATYYHVRQGKWEPVITDIGFCLDGSGRAVLPLNRNDGLVFGVSQLLGYDSVFGYGLENFPLKHLAPGSVFKEHNGYLNIKNPACYVFPEANQCQPGDHFTVAEKEKVQSFIHYRPYAFEMSRLQKMANGTTVLGLLLSGVILGWFAAGKGLSFWRQRTGSTKERKV